MLPSRWWPRLRSESPQRFQITDSLTDQNYHQSLDQFASLRTTALSGRLSQTFGPRGFSSAGSWLGLVDAPSLWPVVGKVTSSFGEREDPFNGEGAFHAGIDISASFGRTDPRDRRRRCRHGRDGQRLRAGSSHRPWPRHQDGLWPYVWLRGVDWRSGSPRAGHWLCGTFRTQHRAACALRGPHPEPSRSIRTSISAPLSTSWIRRRLPNRSTRSGAAVTEKSPL